MILINIYLIIIISNSYIDAINDVKYNVSNMKQQVYKYK